MRAISEQTFFLMGWTEAQAGKPKEGAPFPNDPKARMAWLAGYDAFKDRKPIDLQALRNWGRWDV